MRRALLAAAVACVFAAPASLADDIGRGWKAFKLRGCALQWEESDDGKTWRKVRFELSAEASRDTCGRIGVILRESKQPGRPRTMSDLEQATDFD